MFSSKRALFTIAILWATGVFAQSGLSLIGVGYSVSATNLSPVPISNFQTGVDNAYLTNSSGGIVAPTLTMNLPVAFGGGHNCAIAVVHGSSTYTFTTPSGWTAGPTVTGDNVKMALFYYLGDVSGTTSVSIAATGTGNGNGNALGGWVTELKNCNTTSVGGNGTLDTAATGSAITMTLSAAPTSGDAAIAYFLDTGAQSPPAEDTTVNPGSGFTPLSSSKSFGKIAEYNTSTTSTSVPVTFSGTDTIIGLGIVIKQGAAGTAPPSTLYVSNEQVEQVYATNTAWNFPCTGNLVVGLNSSGGDVISSFAGSTGTWQNAITNTTNAIAQIFYGYGTGFTSALTVTPTYTSTPSPIPGTELKLVCVNNAATSGLLDTTNPGNSNQTAATNLTTVSLTPAATNEIIFFMASIDVHTLTGTVADANGHTPVFLAAIDTKGDDAASSCAQSTPNSSLDEDNGWSFQITNDTTAVTAIYAGTQVTGQGSCTTNPTGSGLNGYAAAAFK